MQCLYCEEELKPFRGLFDEDFCCRDHRDKYLASFRKAMSLSPAFLTQAPENSTAQTTEAGEPATALAAGNTPSDPRMADFREIAVPPVTTAGSYRALPPYAFHACRAIEIPKRETAWSAALEAEERLAELADPVQIVSVAAFGDTPAPVHIAPAQVPAATDKGSAGVSIETAGLAVSSEDNTASGYSSTRNYAEPVPPAAMQLSAPSFCASAGAATLPLEEQHAEVTLFCEPLASAPILACEIALAHECHIPAFAPRREAMQSDEEQEPAPGVAEIAPAMVRTSTPLDRPAVVPGCSSEMIPPSLELASSPAGAGPSRFNVPALASPIEGQPGLAPELVADIPQGEAANSAATPHSHAPLRSPFGSLVRIKNWRLRITFAKPA